MYSKTTKKINVTVKPYYLEDQSEPDKNHYVWAYQITINNFSKDLEVGVHTNSLKNKELEEITDLITIENKHTILSKLSTNLIKSYLDLAIKSNHIFLFTCKKEKEIIGYALFAKKPKYLISEFSNMKFKIFFNLINKLKFF